MYDNESVIVEMSADAEVEVDQPPPSTATSTVSTSSEFSSSSIPVPKLFLSYEPYFKFIKFEDYKNVAENFGVE